MACEHLRTTVGTAPGKTMPFSDHEAVMATLRVDRWDQVKHEGLKPEVVNIMNEAQTEVRVGLHKAVNQRFSTGRMAVLGLLLLLLEAFMALVSLLGFQTEQTFPKLSYYILGSVAFTVLLITGLCHIFHTIEVRLLQETQEQLRLGMQALQERLGQA